MNNTVTSSKQNKQNKPNKSMQIFVNLCTVILIFVIIFVIYKFFIKTKYNKLRVEGFYDSTTLPINTISNNSLDSLDSLDSLESMDSLDSLDSMDSLDSLKSISSVSSRSRTSYNGNNTVYENSINALYGDNIRLKCSLIPSMNNNTNICQINGIPIVIYNFPIHIIKLFNGSILAVFNDGRLYQKDSMLSTIWAGPITNSLPQDTIPLRMITLSTDLVTLLGVGYDNILYMKKPDSKGNLNLTGVWKKVPNNSSIIYVLFDNYTGFLISIDTNGKLFTKSSADITTNNTQLVTKLDRPVLRLYYDINGYMLIIDNNFDLYQFNDLNWKTSELNISRGTNNSKIQDLLYDNDGKLYGLIFNSDAFMVQIMKQNAVFYLADFVNLDQIISSSTDNKFAMSDQDIIKSKIGSLSSYLAKIYENDTTDDDPNFAYQKQILENKAKLRKFCANRNITSGNLNYDNYDLLASVDKNNDKISDLKSILNNLLVYEPESDKIKDKYSSVFK